MDTSNKTIDVVVTATIRPEVMRLTLASFSRYFLNQFKNVRIIINVDPVGTLGRTAEEVLSIVREYFDDVVYRCPVTPSFSNAVRWCWENVESEVFFHLEDDWLLTRKVRFEVIKESLNSDPDIASVRFNKFSNSPTSKTWTLFSLNPSIIRRSFISEALPLFDDSLDPESQFYKLDGRRQEVLSHWTFSCYGKPGDPPYIIDTGLTWRTYHQLGKWRSGDGPVTWQSRTMTHKRWLHMIKYKLHRLHWRSIIHNPFNPKFN